ncbi:legume-like lectin family-domain-containing protein [Radiomyces spectabilis]|uniref:legume-like lectin family-domain-containing protein n=1 Tax=Radiomyces spectabilis TaxID=64574 RepID=UPI00221FA75E|nr:legume-like lectin family-domain-containing protein [Radiomyces spectabilis]KAI8373158.1 legume-like lectin family-domain-containing protein [Radiomyces spectabilis]
MRFLSAILLAATAVTSFICAEAQLPMRTHSIAMPYIDDDLQNHWFDFGGDTIINTNRQIRLTSNQQSQVGFLWSRLPIVDDNFEVEFEFRVHGSSGHLYGDGFAMWLVKERLGTGDVFGATNRFDGLGIFFDTYDNERAHRHTFPYITSMLGNGMAVYENDKDGRTTELVEGCEADFRMKEFPTRGKLTFYRNNYLQLDVMWKEEDVWTQCFKAYKVQLPERMYLGFTAHTGEVTDNHDIVSVEAKSLTAKPIEAAPVVNVPKPKRSSGGFFSFIFKLLVAAGLVAVLFVGYRLYENKNRMKRF